MNKKVKVALIVAAVVVAAYLAYRWYQNRQAGAGAESPTGGLGTNLNSVAPELVGGSTGPAIGPALSAPINITLTEQVAPPPQNEGPDMISGGPNMPGSNPLRRQQEMGSKHGAQPVKTGQMEQTINPGESVPGQVVGQVPAKPKSGIAETKPVPKSEPAKRFTETPEKLNA